MDPKVIVIQGLGGEDRRLPAGERRRKGSPDGTWQGASRLGRTIVIRDGQVEEP